MTSTAAKRVGQWIAIVSVIAVAAGGAVAYNHRVDIQDHFLASSFEPSQRMDEIHHELDLTSTGDRVFLASQPTVGDREKFAQWCARVDHSEEGHVLGCYSDRRIRLFEVTDERLTGIVEVTAVHELLHAVHARMSHREREALAKQLNAAYKELAETDPAFKERMDVYKKLSPAAFANELHSVFATEVADLPPALEAHYAKWITNRDEIVAWYDSYHRVFTELTERAQQLASELEELRGDIEERSAAYDEAVRQFNADAAEFKARNERYEFSGKRELFEEVRDGLLERQRELEATLAGIQADTDRFNEMREELMSLNEISLELNEVLDSNLPSPTSTPDAEAETTH